MYKVKRFSSLTKESETQKKIGKSYLPQLED